MPPCGQKPVVESAIPTEGVIVAVDTLGSWREATSPSFGNPIFAGVRAKSRRSLR